jgi:hypothetical protein
MLAGCSSGDADFGVAQVKGKITVGGKPLTEGQVMFYPEAPLDAAGKSGKLAGKRGYGSLQADGTFRVSTYGKFDGAVVGKHKVAIAPGSPEAAPYGDKYMSPETSGREVEVKPGTENVADFDLQPKAAK